MPPFSFDRFREEERTDHTLNIVVMLRPHNSCTMTILHCSNADPPDLCAKVRSTGRETGESCFGCDGQEAAQRAQQHGRERHLLPGSSANLNTVAGKPGTLQSPSHRYLQQRCGPAI